MRKMPHNYPSKPTSTNTTSQDKKKGIKEEPLLHAVPKGGLLGLPTLKPITLEARQAWRRVRRQRTLTKKGSKRRGRRVRGDE